MPRITNVATATPRNVLTQDHVKTFVESLFGGRSSIERLMPVFDNVLVEKRHFAVDREWFSENHDFTDVNELYIQSALDLSEEVTLALAKQSGLKVTDFDVVFFISTTGLATPSLDARLFNRVGLNPHIKRIPIWGLGCAGGAAALSRAYDYLKAYPSHRALIISVELCGLAFQKDDYSKSNLISTALFSDGAAACLVVGDGVEIGERRPTPSILHTLSTIYPETLDVMAWNITSGGFRVQLSRDIPAIVSGLVNKSFEDILARYEIPRERIGRYIMHPGGAKVLAAYEDSLRIPRKKLEHSYDVLREYGNMSSVTVFFILQRFLEDPSIAVGEYGLVSALGPGFSSELLLLKWENPADGEH